MLLNMRTWAGTDHKATHRTRDYYNKSSDYNYHDSPTDYDHDHDHDTTTPDHLPTARH